MDDFFSGGRRDMVRLGIHEMARLEQALDNEQDEIREEIRMSHEDDRPELAREFEPRDNRTPAPRWDNRTPAPRSPSTKSVENAIGAIVAMDNQNDTCDEFRYCHDMIALAKIALANEVQALGAMLNAEVTLQSVSDSANVPGTLQRQARRDAKALSEAIALLKGIQP